MQLVFDRDLYLIRYNSASVLTSVLRVILFDIGYYCLIKVTAKLAFQLKPFFS